LASCTIYTFGSQALPHANKNTVSNEKLANFCIKILKCLCDGSGKFGGPGRANLFLGRTFDLINYACAGKNDTPLICTVGVKVRMDLSPTELEIEKLTVVVKS